MKKLEVSIGENGVTVRRESEEHLKADQKFIFMMSLLCMAGFLGFFWLMVTH